VIPEITEKNSSILTNKTKVSTESLPFMEQMLNQEELTAVKLISPEELEYRLQNDASEESFEI